MWKSKGKKIINKSFCFFFFKYCEKFLTVDEENQCGQGNIRKRY